MPRAHTEEPFERSCDALVVQVGRAEPDDASALRLARQVVRQTLRGKWRVQPLGAGSRDFEVRRARADKSIRISTAWNLTSKLNAHRDVIAAEPAFVLPGHAPDEAQVGKLFTQAEQLAAKSSGDNADLPCAKVDNWAIKLVSADDAWNLVPTDPSGRAMGKGVIVGHPDTGYTQHPEILPIKAQGGRLRVADGYDFEDGKKDPRDPLEDGVLENPSHGTSTSSVIMSGIGAPVANAMAGPAAVTGVAPLVELVPIRVTTSVVLLSFRNLAKGILHATAKGAHVISISLGGPLRSGFLERAIEHAVDSGVVVLSAAGNVWPWVVYPARLDRVIGVGACNCERERWSKSARGSKVDVSAPGAAVWRAKTEKAHSGSPFDVKPSSGTSYAVAVVAGICALWQAHHGRKRLVDKYGLPRLAAVFKEILINHGVDTPPGWNTTKDGAGIVNAVKVLSATLPNRAPAGGMKTLAGGGAPPLSGRLEPFVPHFPDVDRAGLRAALIDFLSTDETSLGAVLARHGHELLFHVTTNPSVREALGAKATNKMPKRKTPKSVLAADKSFTDCLSRGLRKQIGSKTSPGPSPAAPNGTAQPSGGGTGGSPPASPGSMKLIVTNRKAMRSKHGNAGWKSIAGAIQAMVAADRARGIATRLVALDSVTRAAVEGMSVRDEIASRGGRSLSVAAVYGALDRLARGGLVQSRLSEPTPERGGRSKKHFRIRAAGVRALRKERQLMERMWKDVKLTAQP